MSHDAINNWVEKARQTDAAAGERDGAQVVRRLTPHNRGGLIMEIAEIIRPWLMEFFQGRRDENGMVYQPAHIRGIALNVAQGLLKDKEKR